jgi:integrase
MSEFLRSKARAGRSDRYLQALRNSLSKFQHGRAHWGLAQVTPQVIEAWLAKSDWAPKTRRGYLGDLSTLFRWGVRRGYLASNPAAAVELPMSPAGRSLAVGIHTPAEVASVLEFARAYNLDICRSLALRYFAGIRAAEVQRLAENDLRPAFVDVPAEKAKTRRRRLVSIPPNLSAWLALGGKLPLLDVNNRMRWFTAALKKAHGIGWPPNVPRHCFCTYHLAANENAGKTALQAGHTEQVLFSNYRELATKADGEAFFSIFPK